MAIQEFAFNPADGVENTTSYPNPAPGAARAQVQGILDQIKDYLNTEIKDALNSTTDSASGADNIAMTAVTGLTGATVQSVVEALKTALDEAILGAIPDGSLATAKYADASVTAAKVAADVATQAELDDLAGDGRTTETVKDNADAIATHLLENATESNLGHVMVDGETVFVDENGVLSALGGVEKIADITLASDTSQVDFESLGLENYKTIQLSCIVESTDSTSKDLIIRFNDDSTPGNYENRAVIVTTASNYTGSAIINAGYVGYVPYSTGGFASSIINISNIGTKNKLFNFCGYEPSQHKTIIGGGGWLNVASSISKISILPSALSLKAGSRFILLGVK